MGIHINEIRKEFPLFQREDPLIYFDNGATTQKPKAVIERLAKYYREENANIHRGSYPLSNRASVLYEHARATVAKWLDAEAPEEVVFTKGCTEAINLAAAAVGETWLQQGDNVVVTELEHSSNFYPWQHQCEKYGANLRIAEAQNDGSILADAVINLIDKRTKLVAITAMSNVTGFRPDLHRIIEAAHEKGCYVLVDAAQEIAHHIVSVRKMDCDFLCFSSHKIYGPMGVGVLYGKKKLLEELKPYLYGGDMVEKGDCGCICYRRDPGKFEAGTQNIEGALGLEAALEFLQQHDFEKLIQYEQQLGRYLKEQLQRISGIHLLGSDVSASVISFEADAFGAYDIGVLLGNYGIAVRCGAHCAYPLMMRMGRESSCRVSLAFYNTKEEVDRLVNYLNMLMKTAGVQLPEPHTILPANLPDLPSGNYQGEDAGSDVADSHDYTGADAAQFGKLL